MTFLMCSEQFYRELKIKICNKLKGYQIVKVRTSTRTTSTTNIILEFHLMKGVYTVGDV